MTDLLKLHKEIVVHFWKAVNSIPNFIDTTDMSHKKCYNVFKETMADICPLLDSDILPYRKLHMLYKGLEKDIVIMIDYDGLVAIYFYYYIQELLEYFSSLCEESEVYEVSANLSKFIDIMNKNKPEYI